MQLTKVMFTDTPQEKVLTTSFYPSIKRLTDVTFSFIGILLISPLLVLTALIIKLSSPGPVLFWQKRAGIKGKIIYFPKFRSMYSDAEQRKADLISQNDHKDSITFKMKNDPRVTPFGRIIRKLSIDELPQLFLVLKGDLSLVGPRPATLDEVKQYNIFAKRRLNVKPGLTCIWQVSGRGDIPFKEQVFMDYTYICERNTLLDLKLIFLTIPVVISGKGAY